MEGAEGAQGAGDAQGTEGAEGVRSAWSARRAWSAWRAQRVRKTFRDINRPSRPPSLNRTHHALNPLSCPPVLYSPARQPNESHAASALPPPCLSSPPQTCSSTAQCAVGPRVPTSLSQRNVPLDCVVSVDRLVFVASFVRTRQAT